MIKVVHVCWESSCLINKSFKDALTMFYMRIPDDGKPHTLHSDSNIDLLLKRVAAEDYDWCVVHGSGVIYDDQTKLVIEFKKYLSSLPENTLVVGQLINKKNFYCGIHEQCFAVNLRVYKKLGYPKFGNYEKREVELRNYLVEGDIHGGYTPLVVYPSEGKSKYTTWTCGWGLTSTSLENDMKIYNIPDVIRDIKIYLYPEDEIEKINDNLESLFKIKKTNNINQNRLMLYLISRKLGINISNKLGKFKYKEKKSCIFVFNTEKLIFNEKWVSRNRREINKYLGPCSGLLEFSNLITFGFSDKTEIIYFDYNQEAIDYKKEFWNSFDGGLEELCDYSVALAKKNGYIIDFTSEEKNLTELNKILKENNVDFKSLFKKIKKLNKTYLCLDFINLNDIVLEKIESSESALLCYSDIFLGQNELLYGYEELNLKYNQFVQRASTKDNLIISGKNLIDKPIIDFAKNYTNVNKHQL